MTNRMIETTNWIEALDIINQAKQHFKENAGKMSEYEAETTRKEIDNFKEKHEPIIEAGVLSEYEGALIDYQSAEKKKAEAYSKEISRWNYTEVNNARAMITERIKIDAEPMQSADELKSLESLYNENKAGDINIQRAAAEAFRGVVQLVPSHLRIAANHIAYQARQDLQELRKTPELVESESHIENAKKEVDSKIKTVVRVGEILGRDITSVYGGVDPLGKAIRRVQKNDAGHLIILDANDPKLINQFFTETTPGSGVVGPAPAEKLKVVEIKPKSRKG